MEGFSERVCLVAQPQHEESQQDSGFGAQQTSSQLPQARAVARPVMSCGNETRSTCGANAPDYSLRGA